MSKRTRKAAQAAKGTTSAAKGTSATSNPAPDNGTSIMNAIRNLTTTVNEGFEKTHKRLDDHEQRLLDLEEWATAPDRKPTTVSATRGSATIKSTPTPTPTPSATSRKDVREGYKYFNRFTYQYEYEPPDFDGLCRVKEFIDPFHGQYVKSYAEFRNGRFYRWLISEEIWDYRKESVTR